MKVQVFVLLFVLSAVNSRKIAQVDKHVNTAFINMEGGGSGKPASKPVTAGDSKLLQSGSPTPKPVVQAVPATVKPQAVKPAIVKPNPQPVKVSPAKPAGPSPAPVSTPGPGTVKQLVTFYDSQGKASVVRPYSYSQAVKQGMNPATNDGNEAQRKNKKVYFVGRRNTSTIKKSAAGFVCHTHKQIMT